MSIEIHVVRTVYIICNKVMYIEKKLRVNKCGSRGGGQGVRTPPGKSQVIWVSIGNYDWTSPGKSWTPWKMLDPLWNLEKLYFSLKLTI